VSATVFALYRYTFPDGHAKEWALGERADGQLEVRWGHAGRLVQREQYPAARRTDLAHRVAAKVRKGYVAVGRVCIDDTGRPAAVVGAPPCPPAARPRAPVPRIDLAALDTGAADYWF
jgi:hypothetical protein